MAFGEADCVEGADLECGLLISGERWKGASSSWKGRASAELYCPPGCGWVRGPKRGQGRADQDEVTATEQG